MTVRIAAALVMIPPVLVCVYLGYPVFNIFVAVMVMLMAWEWRRLAYEGAFGAGGAVFALFLLAAMLAGSLGEYGAALAFLGVITAMFAVKALLGSSQPDTDSGTVRPFWMSLGALYIGLPALALLWIRGDGENGRDTVYWLFALVWAADTGAYAVGRLIGGPKLAPAISPNKTWAGLAGCVFSAALVGTAAAYFTRSGDVLMMTALSALIGLVSQGGDLVESAIKRHFDVKDSGHLIPGHGGILDRVDALMAAVLFAALIKLAYGGSIVR